MKLESYSTLNAPLAIRFHFPCKLTRFRFLEIAIHSWNILNYGRALRAVLIERHTAFSPRTSHTWPSVLMNKFIERSSLCLSV